MGWKRGQAVVLVSGDGAKVVWSMEYGVGLEGNLYGQPFLVYALWWRFGIAMALAPLKDVVPFIDRLRNAMQDFPRIISSLQAMSSLQRPEHPTMRVY